MKIGKSTTSRVLPSRVHHASQEEHNTYLSFEELRDALTSYVNDVLEGPKFHKFLELPLELRQEIYAHYFRDNRASVCRGWPDIWVRCPLKYVDFPKRIRSALPFDGLCFLPNLCFVNRTHGMEAASFLFETATFTFSELFINVYGEDECWWFFTRSDEIWRQESFEQGPQNDSSVRSCRIQYHNKGGRLVRCQPARIHTVSVQSPWAAGTRSPSQKVDLHAFWEGRMDTVSRTNIVCRQAMATYARQIKADLGKWARGSKVRTFIKAEVSGQEVSQKFDWEAEDLDIDTTKWVISILAWDQGDDTDSEDDDGDEESWT
ncbi:hypothetical protein BDV96DRAFT_659105 [Lophiotrema nucula]|uniref:Uncharacterized protein n=1 Tax=Lophiotrema nucula TaxID=690887 RepID=A0A6A5Z8N4_9PLEO|nr:hypothetical protein BDV96DRAFT_659105 [Lophiotrema nucula]